MLTTRQPVDFSYTRRQLEARFRHDATCEEFETISA
jgi:hypothetical protein